MRMLADKTGMPVKVGDRVAVLPRWEWRSAGLAPCSAFTSKGWTVQSIRQDGHLILGRGNSPWGKLVRSDHAIVHQRVRRRA